MSYKFLVSKSIWIYASQSSKAFFCCLFRDIKASRQLLTFTTAKMKRQENTGETKSPALLTKQNWLFSNFFKTFSPGLN